MAPFIHLLIALAFATAIVASPHIPRHHPVRPIDVRVGAPAVRRRSLNKRCIPPPSNSTSVAPYSTPSPSSFSTSSSSTSTSTSSSTSTTSTSSSSSVPTPEPTTSAPLNVAPAPSPSPTPTPTSSQPPPATESATSGGPSYLTGTQQGQGTYYSTGLGACGITNNDSQHIAAVSHILFDSFPGYNNVNPNTNPVCNRQVTASYGGKSVTVTITDRCEACKVTDLDFSPSAFMALADESLGRIDIEWHWV